MGQDTPHGPPATRCPPWLTHGCHGPQKLGRVGKSLQDMAGESLSPLGSERVPGAEKGQGRCCDNSMALVGRWMPAPGGRAPSLVDYAGCDPPGFPMLWERGESTGIAVPDLLDGPRFSMSCSLLCAHPAGPGQGQRPRDSFPAPQGFDNPLPSPPPPPSLWNSPHAGKGSVGFTAG